MDNIPEHPRDALMRKVEAAECFRDIKIVLVEMIIEQHNSRPSINMPDLPYEINIVGGVATIKSITPNPKGE